MEELRLTFRDVVFYGITANVILGVLFGSISLVLGFKLDRRGLGVIGFVVTALGGAVLGLFLSYPLTLLFIWLLFRGPKSDDAPAEISSATM
jgi:hypothetical protein